jgi:AcrR family transcriptional regulator
VRSICQAQNVRSRGMRDALLNATRQTIEEDGYDKLTMAADAARADITRRAVGAWNPDVLIAHLL